MKQCPVCKIDFIILELHNIEIDYCISCEGIWLDSGELGLILNEEDDKKVLHTFFPVDNSEVVKEISYKCPICKIKMEKLHMKTNSHEIIIDQCPKYHGIWFDKGELIDLLSTIELVEKNQFFQTLKDIFKKDFHT